MTSKLRIKFGQAEIEFEGESEFIKDHLMEFTKSLIQFSAAKTSPASNKQNDNEVTSDGELSLSTNSIAAKIGANDCPGLALAALAHLQLCKGESLVDKAAILREMKTVTGIYKNSMSSNLSKALPRLMRAGKVNEQATGKFSLSNGERSNIEAQISH
jgi:hypothetical protein